MMMLTMVLTLLVLVTVMLVGMVVVMVMMMMIMVRMKIFAEEMVKVTAVALKITVKMATGSVIMTYSQGARRTYRAPPSLLPGTFHYGSKMYLRVSRTQSHLFPGQPLGYTGVIALCARVSSCFQSVAD